MRKWIVLIGVCLLAFALLYACGGPRDPYKDDNPTSGHILILADEDLRSIVEEEEMVFESIYENAHIDVRYLPEAQLLKAMMNDSVRLVISTVLPGAEQQAYLDKRTVKPRPVAICTDGIAVVMNKERHTGSLNTVTIKRLLMKVEPGWLAPVTWAELDSSQAQDISTPVSLFPENGSGVARSLVDSLFKGPGALYALSLPTIDSVIARVAADPRCIGFLPFAAISDMDDPHVRQLRDQVRLVPVSKDRGEAFLPSQSTLADGSYPLRRTVYMVLTEGKSGLGTGFVSFVANHKGQRIILKKGLAPTHIPAREVEIVTQ